MVKFHFEVGHLKKAQVWWVCSDWGHVGHLWILEISWVNGTESLTEPFQARGTSESIFTTWSPNCLWETPVISQSCASKERDSSEIERFMLLPGFYALYLSPLVKLISFFGRQHLTLQSTIQVIYHQRWHLGYSMTLRKELTLQCAAMRPLVLHDAPDPPQYFILGGLVFVPLTESLLMDDFGISARVNLLTSIGWRYVTVCPKDKRNASRIEVCRFFDFRKHALTLCFRHLVSLDLRKQFSQGSAS